MDHERILDDAEVAALTEHQLLSHLLWLAGTPRGDDRAAAHSLLNDHNDLTTVLHLPAAQLDSDPRLVEGAGAFLALVGAMMDRYLARFRRNELVVTDAETVGRLLEPHMRECEAERVCVICVDTEFHLLGSGAVVTMGEKDSIAFPIRRILDVALASEAYGIILAHNHPDGNTRFSRTDLVTTEVLRGKLTVLDISLLDHYIWVPSSGPVSLYAQLHNNDFPVLSDHWDVSTMPLLSRLDPAVTLANAERKRNRPKPRASFFVDENGDI